MTPRLALAALAAAAALTVAACGSSCQDLGDRICSCQPLGTLRDNCRSSIQNELGSGYGQASSADQAMCQKLLTTCPDFGSRPDLCRILTTQDGMVACGMAYPPVAGAAP
jgi:hypothetical protein